MEGQKKKLRDFKKNKKLHTRPAHSLRADSSIKETIG